MKYYVIDLSKFNIPSAANVMAGYGIYEIARNIMMQLSAQQNVIELFIRL